MLLAMLAHSSGPSEIKLWGFLYSEWGVTSLCTTPESEAKRCFLRSLSCWSWKTLESNRSARKYPAPGHGPRRLLRSLPKSHVLERGFASDILTKGVLIRVRRGMCDGAAIPQTSFYTVGLMLWFTRKTFVGSYVFLRATSRSYFLAPYAILSRAC